MSNIKTIIEADASKHDSTMRKSANEVYKYQKKVEGAKKSIGAMVSTVGKFAGALGLAVSATKLLVDGLRSIESVSDSLAKTQRVTNTVINDFFASANQGGFSNFINGLKDTIQAAKDAYDAIDKLQTFKDFSNSDLSKIESKVAEANYYIKALKGGVITEADAGGSLKEWQDKLKTYQAERLTIIQHLIKEYDDAITKEETEIFGKFKNNPNFKNWMDTYTGSAFKNELAGETFAKMEAELDEFTQRSIELNDLISRNGVGWAAKEGKQMAESIKNERAAWVAVNGELYNFLDNLLDKEQKISDKNKLAAEMYKTQTQNWNSLSSEIRDLKPGKSNGGGGNTSASTSSASEKVEIIPDVILDEEALNDYFGYLYSYLEAQNPELTVNLKVLDGAIDEHLKRINEQMEEQAIKAEMNRLALQRQMEQYEAIGTVVGSVGDVFDSLGDSISGDDGKMIKFIGNAMSAIARIIPQIASLFVAKEAQSLAGVTASASELPFPYNLAAIAASVAEVIALFASFPKFAEGGIFQGNSSIGDFNVARVNSGEMILNGSQQKRLFGILNGTALQGPINTGDVTFRISGNDLVGTLNNYNTKRGRVI